MNVKINNHEYELKENNPYSIGDNTVILNILTDSVDELVNIIGKEAVVVIPEDIAWNGLIFNKITRIWNDSFMCEVVFSFKNLEKTVEDHTNDIEAMSEAIVELAEIIGGDE